MQLWYIIGMMHKNKAGHRSVSNVGWKSAYHYSLRGVGKVRNRFVFLGLLFGVSSYLASLTPSLVPRPWYLQGLAAGIALVIGYYFGVLLSFILRKVIRRELPKPIKRVAWILLGTWIVVLSSFELIQSIIRQRELSLMMTGQWEGNAQIVWVAAGIIATTALVAFLLVQCLRLIRAIFRRLNAFMLRRKFVQKVPEGLWRGFIALVGVGCIALLATDVGLRTLRDGAESLFGTNNAAVSMQYAKPDSSLLSGSDDSLVSWESLGSPGRQFIAAPPTVDMIKDFHPTKKVEQPIRVYVGTELSPNIKEQARLAVKELERTGAFKREVIQIVNTTGSGGVDLSAVRPLEYMFAGNTATVTVQYSFFPSWLSLVTDRQRSQDAARELINQIYAAREKSGSKSRILVFGESLGSYGIETAFSSPQGLFAKTDGVMLVGAPGFNPLLQQLTDDRNTGSPASKPVYKDEKEIVFIAGSNNSKTVDTPITQDTGLVYLQNPTDPVAKWNPNVIWHEPEWVREQIKQGTSRFEWHPLVSFVQITTDMILSLEVPEGYGHNYGANTVPIWSELAAPPDWNAQKDAKLKDTLANLASK